MIFFQISQYFWHLQQFSSLFLRGRENCGGKKKVDWDYLCLRLGLPQFAFTSIPPLLPILTASIWTTPQREGERGQEKPWRGSGSGKPVVRLTEYTKGSGSVSGSGEPVLRLKENTIGSGSSQDQVRIRRTSNSTYKKYQRIRIKSGSRSGEPVIQLRENTKGSGPSQDQVRIRRTIRKTYRKFQRIRIRIRVRIRAI